MAGDNPHAKSAVSALILRLGFSPLDMGSLDGAAASIEDIPHRRFDNWRSPLLFSFMWYIVLYAVISLRYDGYLRSIWEYVETIRSVSC